MTTLKQFRAMGHINVRRGMKVKVLDGSFAVIVCGANDSRSGEPLVCCYGTKGGQDGWWWVEPKDLTYYPPKRNNSRECSKCGRVKDFEFFDIDRSTTTGVRSSCKDCRSQEHARKVEAREAAAEKAARKAAMKKWNVGKGAKQ